MENKAGAGGLFINADDRWIEGFAIHMGDCSIDAAELRALYQGLVIARQRGASKLLIESDSKSSVDMILRIHLIHQWTRHYRYPSYLKHPHPNRIQFPTNAVLDPNPPKERNGIGAQTTPDTRSARPPATTDEPGIPPNRRRAPRDRRPVADPPPSASAPDEFRVSKVLFDRYEVGRLLGCGAFAKVYHARHAPSGQSVAIKIISKPKALNGGLAPNIRREITIMRRLRHPHVVRLHEVLASRSKIYFVLEYAKGGELFARVASRGRLPEDASRRLFQQLVSAIGFCHSRGVFHRDLKPENLLLDDAGNLKVSDFGLSAVAPDQLRFDGLLHTLCGTPAYVAPEVLSKRGYDGAKVDVWSCGVILFVLIAGYLPFNDPNLMAMYRKIYRGEYRCPRWTSPELRRLLSKLLDTNPATRITVDGIIRDPWFRKGLEEDRMLALMRFHEEVEEKLEVEGDSDDADRDLNAFDIISFSPGFDLSGLFDQGTGSRRERFVSGETEEVVLAAVEEAGKGEGLVVRRRRRGPRGGAAVEGPAGDLVAWVEVHRLTAELVVVVVERGGWPEDDLLNGEEEWRLRETFWKDKLEPAMRKLASRGPWTEVAEAAGARIEPAEAAPGVDPGETDADSLTDSLAIS